MKKIITFLLFVAVFINLSAQYTNEQNNLKKYWYYRKRLKENFIFISPYNLPGSNIPLDCIQPKTKMINGSVVPEEIKWISWDDCNGALPHYIMVLATEFKLLKMYNQNTDANATLQELNRAVQALKRLDVYTDGVENGVYRRNDVKYFTATTSRHIDTLGVHQPLVNFFDNKSGDNIPLKYSFAERFKNDDDHKNMYPNDPPELWEHKKVVNEDLDKYNSVDNIIKFIEAETVVCKMLEGEAGSAVAICNMLKQSVKLMIMNMYHPDEPRKIFNRNAISNGLGLMQRKWYLKDPDLTTFSPKNLIPEEKGGGADFYTFATSYGLAKSAKKLNLDYYGTDFSAYFFKRLMNFENQLLQVRFYEVRYECDNSLDTALYFIGEDNSRFSPNPCLRFFCGQRYERLIETKDISWVLKDKSFWMIRSLTATNNISPHYMEFLIPKRSTYRFLNDCKNRYPYDLEHYPLMWSILNTKKYISNNDRDFIGNLLNKAPACGPYNFEYYFESSDMRFYDYNIYEWSCPNRFVWPEHLGGGYAKEWKRSGYYNGLDYMLLHNLYWLTRINQTEYNTEYVDNILRNQSLNISNNSVYDCARSSVKLLPGFKLTINGDNKYIASTNNQLRTGYDSNNSFYKVNVTNYSSDCNCEPIFKNYDYLEKSANIYGEEEDEAPSKLSLNIFPNPGNDAISVICNEPIQHLLMLNSMGDVIMRFTELNTLNYTFTISHLPAGIYVLKVKTIDGYEKNEKIIKKE